MDWREIPQNESLVELAAIVSEAEFVLSFGEDVTGRFRLTVFEDLRCQDPESRFFARAQEATDPLVSALATGATPEAVATQCVREAGVSLRRARGR